MRLVALLLLAAFAASTVDAGSYQQKDGTIVDPILKWTTGSPHPYSGENLEPNTDLTDADLGLANLTGANLSYADLSHAHLYRADLSFADLLYADLSGSILNSAKYWEYANWPGAYYYIDNVPTWDSGMDQAWRDSVGILALLPGAITPGPGDYNLDGIVDAADYTVWRDEDSPDSTTAGYALWVDNFGQSIASGSWADHVPEPTTLLLTLLALVAVPLRVRCG